MNKPKKLYIITSDSLNMGNNGMSELIFPTIMEVLSEVCKNYLLLFEMDFSNSLDIFWHLPTPMNIKIKRHLLHFRRQWKEIPKLPHSLYNALFEKKEFLVGKMLRIEVPSHGWREGFRSYYKKRTTKITQ